MRRLSFPLVVCLLASPASAFAQQAPNPVQRNAAWLNFGFGGTDDGTHRGGAIAAGLSVQVRRVFVTVTPMDLILWKGDTYPYRSESIGNNQDICRDSRNGQFADDSLCRNVDAANALTVDVAVAIPRTPILIGVGSRYDRHDNPWFIRTGVQGKTGGTAMWSLTFNAGPSYFSAVAAVSIPFASF